MGRARRRCGRIDNPETSPPDPGLDNPETSPPDPVNDIRNKMNIPKIINRRGRPKGTTKPFWEFSRNKTVKRKRNPDTVPSVSKSIKTENVNNIVDIEDTSSVDNDPPESINWIFANGISLTTDHKNSIRNGSLLDDQIIDVSQSIIKEQFNVCGFQSSVNFQNIDNFAAEKQSFIQILFQGNLNSGHWLTVSSTHCKDSEINVYDSLNTGTVSSDVRRQICSLMKSEADSITINVQNMDKQTGGRDCGIFAIAYAVSLALGKNPAQYIYFQRQLRSHLLTCLEKQSFTEFPGLTTQQPHNPTVKIIDIFCICRLAHDESNPHMIQCDTCEEWFHFSCLGITDTRRKHLLGQNNKTPFHCSEFCSHK